MAVTLLFPSILVDIFWIIFKLRMTSTDMSAEETEEEEVERNNKITN
jgi:hypothetical protein